MREHLENTQERADASSLTLRYIVGNVYFAPHSPQEYSVHTVSLAPLVQLGLLNTGLRRHVTEQRHQKHLLPIYFAKDRDQPQQGGVPVVSIFKNIC